jgi:hypothetical protein
MVWGAAPAATASKDTLFPQLNKIPTPAMTIGAIQHVAAMMMM